MIDPGATLPSPGHITDDLEIDPIAMATRRAVDRRILLPALVTVFLMLVDRTNIGIAALQMNSALAIGTTAFGLVTGALSVGSALSAVPSNLIAARVGAARWMGVLTVSWGASTILMGFAQNVSQAVALRFLLGVFEGGYIPALLYWFGNWYEDRSRGRAISMLAIPQNAAILVSGPLGGALLGLHPIVGWRWLFIIEGIPAVLVGLLWFRMPETFDNVRWLAPRCRDWLTDRLAAERASKTGGVMSFGVVLRRPEIWVYAFLWFWFVGASFGMMAWLPQILRANFHNGLTTFQIGVLTALPPVLGIITAAIMTVTLYKTRDRRWHIVLLTLISVGGLVGSVLTDDPVVRVALYVLALGISAPLTGAFWSAPLAVLDRSAMAVGLAVISTIGTLGSAFAPSAIGGLKTLTGSFDGGVLSAAGMFLIAALVPLLVPRLFPKASSRQLTKGRLSKADEQA